MSIDARVMRVEFGQNGNGILFLADRDSSSCRGQPELHFDARNNQDAALLAGQNVWGSANNLVLGSTVIADREGYSRIKFKSGEVARAIRFIEGAR